MKMTLQQIEGIIYEGTKATKFREESGQLGPLTRDMAAGTYVGTNGHL